MKALLQERIYFSGAEQLYRELEQLDPAFRANAKVIDWEYEEDITFNGNSTLHYRVTFEAELDVSS